MRKGREDKSDKKKVLGNKERKYKKVEINRKRRPKSRQKNKSDRKKRQ